AQIILRRSRCGGRVGRAPRSGRCRRRSLAGTEHLKAQTDAAWRVPGAGCVARARAGYPIPSDHDRFLVVIAAAPVAVGEFDEDRSRARTIILERIGERLR